MRIIYYWTCTSATLLIYLSIFSIIDSANSASLMSQKRSRRHVIDLQNPKDVIQVLDLLEREAHGIEENLNEQKRGLDLGLARGFSGNQAAKHLLGLSVANMAHGPGKRRRRSIIKKDHRRS